MPTSTPSWNASAPTPTPPAAPDAAVATSDELRRAALRRSAERNAVVARRRVAWRWVAWALRLALVSAAGFALVAAAAWILWREVGTQAAPLSPPRAASAPVPASVQLRLDVATPPSSAGPPASGPQAQSPSSPAPREETAGEQARERS
ncbi:MAG: hypothetical protein IV094_26155 [Vitreoscilla sp.]|nr:hypothetical protein [Vitreoscilla sp.]